MLIKRNIVIWMDDLRYISRWLRTFFGDTIQAHF